MAHCGEIALLALRTNTLIFRPHAATGGEMAWNELLQLAQQMAEPHLPVGIRYSDRGR